MVSRTLSKTYRVVADTMQIRAKAEAATASAALMRAESKVEALKRHSATRHAEWAEMMEGGCSAYLVAAADAERLQIAASLREAESEVARCEDASGEAKEQLTKARYEQRRAAKAEARARAEHAPVGS